MPRQVQKLTSAQVDALTEPGKYLDGDGLWLQVAGGGTKSWILRYTFRGRTREMGLGPLVRVTLAEARKRVKQLRVDMQNGIDPLAQKSQALAAKAMATPFKEEAEDYIATHRSGWKSRKCEQQWRNTLKRYAYPVIGNVPVSEVSTEMVIKILSPIWDKKTETASRVRNRIELILSAAKAKNRRTGENPAAWRGHLAMVFPRPSKVHKVRHHPALHYDKMPGFLDELRQQKGDGGRALAFTILCAVRTTDACGMVWGEVDFAIGVWTIPEERGKTRGLRIPLSAPALAILEALYTEGAKPGDYVFPGQRPGRPLSTNAMLSVLERMGYRGPDVPTVATTHGFRSTFRDWVGDKTQYPREVAEMALAHAVGDDTEEAYRRSDAFEKRRSVMREWSIYCCGTLASDGNLGQLIAPRKLKEPARNARGRSVTSLPHVMSARPPEITPERLAELRQQSRRPVIGRGLAMLLGMDDAEVERHNREVAAKVRAAE